MNSINLVPISCCQLVKRAGECLVVDTRPSSQHCCKHLKNSENINFSNILLRRLLKGVVQLSTLIPSQELSQKLSLRDSEKIALVVYDSSSKLDSVKTELLRHAEVLARTDLGKTSDKTVYFLDGGLDALSREYPHMCISSSIKKAHSPLGISVSASLPIFDLSGKKCKKQYPKLQTPSAASDDNQFGPPVEILPHLILGCARDSSNLTVLRKKGVTAVLNVSHNCPNHFESLLEYRSIPVQDSYQADLLSKMDTAIGYINAIKSKNGCVFVHCHAGISRSATICIAYIMKMMSWNLSKAYEFVKEKRPCISPNLHFMGQLLEFEKQLQLSNKEAITEDITDGCLNKSLPPLSGTDTTGWYYDVSLHDCTSSVVEEMEFSSVALSSASAPSSLNFDSKPSKLADIDEVLSELATKNTGHRTATKPKTLPLKQSMTPPLKQSMTLPLKQSTTPPLRLSSHLSISRPVHTVTETGKASNSLPTTPTSAHCHDHIPTLSPLTQLSRMPHPLQHSPCRVAAQLGSRSESCLNYYSSLAESM